MSISEDNWGLYHITGGCITKYLYNKRNEILTMKNRIMTSEETLNDLNSISPTVLPLCCQNCPEKIFFNDGGIFCSKIGWNISEKSQYLRNEGCEYFKTKVKTNKGLKVTTRELISRILNDTAFPLSITEILGKIKNDFGKDISYQAVQKQIKKLLEAYEIEGKTKWIYIDSDGKKHGKIETRGDKYIVEKHQRTKMKVYDGELVICDQKCKGCFSSMYNRKYIESAKLTPEKVKISYRCSFVEEID